MGAIDVYDTCKAEVDLRFISSLTGTEGVKVVLTAAVKRAGPIVQGTKYMRKLSPLKGLLCSITRATYAMISRIEPNTIATMYPHVLFLMPNQSCATMQTPKIAATIAFPGSVGRYMKLAIVRSHVSRVHNSGNSRRVALPVPRPIPVEEVKLDMLETCCCCM